ncbi:hypothetical protein K2173_022740 [Erythroxylum novogranatense]|uniref:Alliinase C-terminal domain-containing protein n=1 Tax=Erythroxylum novogranatense TaxID=1862640 RepID=A0AAV8SNE1_9ROSI|nr:hypothetical protein K2173_022740 [Erythroxylum novogranatense]
MGKFLNSFSTRHLLVTSLALNVSLLLMVFFKTGADGLDGVSLLKQVVTLAAIGGLLSELHAFHRTQKTTTSASSSTVTIANLGKDRVIDLDHGDPTMYERYWQQVGDKSSILIPGWRSVSYLSDPGNVCWFLEPEFAKQVTRLHKIVRNAETEGRHIVVGTGSTQLVQALLYALSPQDAKEPINVVSAAPYYSCYPDITDCLKSGLYKWAGDARSFNKDGPYIEIVNTPNNPDGTSGQAVVNRSRGTLIYDLAYYWPQYTPIASPADHDIMLFTVSKCTGHAGMRIGWALVKDLEIAKKMIKYIEITTIGVSKDSQLRAAKVLTVVSDSVEHPKKKEESFFDFGYSKMSERWKLLKAAVEQSGLFTLPELSPEFCKFSGKLFGTQPAFAWLKCNGPVEDCEALLRENKILARSGKHFGASRQFVRISMLDREENIGLFIERLSKIRIEKPM